MKRRTVVVEGPLAFRMRRIAAARRAEAGMQIMTLPQLAARLAGGFARPARSQDLDPAIRTALEAGGFADLESIRELPGHDALGRLDADAGVERRLRLGRPRPWQRPAPGSRDDRGARPRQPARRRADAARSARCGPAARWIMRRRSWARSNSIASCASRRCGGRYLELWREACGSPGAIPARPMSLGSPASVEC